MTAQDPMRGDVAVLVLGAGLGTRLGPGEPKALRTLGGVPLLAHAVRRMAAARGVGYVVVTVPPAAPVDEVRGWLAPHLPVGLPLHLVIGGVTRQASVAAALRATPEAYQVILVHDAARALAPTRLAERVIEAVRAGHSAVIPTLPVVDTIKAVDAAGFVTATVDREPLRVVQTPQGFARAVLAAAHHGGDGFIATDDAGLAERVGAKVFCVPGFDVAMKITRPSDLALAELLLNQAEESGA